MKTGDFNDEYNIFYTIGAVLFAIVGLIVYFKFFN